MAEVIITALPTIVIKFTDFLTRSFLSYEAGFLSIFLLLGFDCNVRAIKLILPGLKNEASYQKHGQPPLQDDCKIGAGEDALAFYCCGIRRSGNRGRALFRTTAGA